MCHSLFSQNLFQPKGIRKKYNSKKMSFSNKKNPPIFTIVIERQDNLVNHKIKNN